MKIRVLFARQAGSVQVSVKHGRLASASQLSDVSEFTLELSEARTGLGSRPTLVTVRGDVCSFSFLARDVSSAYPLYIPEYGAAVVPGEDSRSYAEVTVDIASRGLTSDHDRMNNAAEESYAKACRKNRDQYCPVWLGVGRDMRMFHVALQNREAGFSDYQYWGAIEIRNHSRPVLLDPTEPGSHYRLKFVIGPGESCKAKITHRLDDGVLPILHSIQDEESIQYRVTAFATLEDGPLAPGRVKGTDYEVCYANTGGNMLSGEEQAALRERMLAETVEREQEVVCILRVEAVNVSKAPAYAWFKAAYVGTDVSAGKFSVGLKDEFERGFSRFPATGGRVIAINRMNGDMMPDEEMAVLVLPGEQAVFEMLVPHSPISTERAERLAKLDFAAHLAGCQAFWREKLSAARAMAIPEAAIHERVQAGLLHLDLNLLGRSDSGPLLATIGWYSPIGTESAPIIQFLDSVGRHDLAGRSLDFFLVRQRPDGFIQNFNNYQSETGHFLWTCAEHYRYSDDIEWLRRSTPGLKKACDYLLAWRERNKVDEYRELGYYGLVSGKVADPDDFFHSFYLNAGTYLGLSGMAEVLQATDSAYAAHLAAEVALYREDIRAALRDALARAPVVPFGDGSWGPLCAPWGEHNGISTLYVDGGKWFTHGSFAARGVTTGPLYLALTDIFAADSPEMTMLVKANQHPCTRENASLSQPYYCRHDYAHLRRGEVKLYLKAFYNQLTALQDRESYAFWEHYHGASQYKTHEEAWMLMQVRWMLYWENDRDGGLDLFRMIPRQWLSPGQKIALQGMKTTHFGGLTAIAEASEDELRCVFQVEKEAPNFHIRLPHPQQRMAIHCEGGIYDAHTETVTAPGGKDGKVVLKF